MKGKKLIALYILNCLIFTTIFWNIGGYVPVQAEENRVCNPVRTGENVIWSCIYFGTYYDKTEEIQKKIKWRVLSTDGKEAFLISDKILDAGPYHDGDEGVTWEGSSLRSWLNTTFYKEAFTEEEQKMIQKTSVVTQDNPDYATPGGKETMDYIYLLSIEEATDIRYGFSGMEYYGEGRMAVNTAYVAAGGSEGEIMRREGQSDWWWLRSAGFDETCGAQVMNTGYISNYGSKVNCKKCGIRPVLHLNLKDTSVWSYAGMADKEGIVPALQSIRGQKIKNRYKKGESLSLDDLSVVADYQSFELPVTGYTTNAAEIDMSTAGVKDLIITYQENGIVKSCSIVLHVEEDITAIASTSENTEATIKQEILPTAIPKQVTGINISTSGDRIRISWKNQRVSGYRIEIKSGKKTNIKETEKTSLTIKKSSRAQTYRIRITAYQMKNGKKVYGKTGAYTKKITLPAKVNVKTVKALENKITVSWKKTAGSGYQLLVSSDKKFKKNTKQYRIPSSKILTKMVKVNKKNKICYVKIRAFRTSGKVKYYGAYSRSRRITVKSKR